MKTYIILFLAILLSPLTAHGQYIQSSGDYLNINGYQQLTVDVGATLYYYWGSVDGRQFESTYTADRADACVGGIPSAGTIKPWLANTAGGSISQTVQPCQSGVTYTITYRIYKSNNQTVTKNLIVRVSGNPMPPPTPTPTATATSGVGVNPNNTVSLVFPTANNATAVFTPASQQGSAGAGASGGSAIEQSYAEQSRAIQNTLLGSVRSLVYTFQGKTGDAPASTIAVSSTLSNGAQGSASAGSSTGGTPASSNITAGSNNCKSLQKDLSKGATGDDVLTLTRVLVKQKFLTEEKSIFDDAVFNAVVAFQELYRSRILALYNLVKGTGFVGPSTREYMNGMIDCFQTVASCGGQQFVRAQYIKIPSSGYSWVSWKEIEIYDDKGAKMTPVSATAQYVWNNYPSDGQPHNAELVYDGNVSTAWGAGETNPGCNWNTGAAGRAGCGVGGQSAWISLNMGALKNISKMRLLTNNNPSPSPMKHQILLSPNNEQYTPFASFNGNILTDNWLETACR